MYRMAIITMCAPASLASKIDLHRCTIMALVHDMAESLVGDITPVDGVSKPEKSRREEETMDYLCTQLLGNVDGGGAGKTIRGAWQEYEDSVTPESLFVHDVDKVELVLQMIEYEKAHQQTKNLSEFAYVCSKVVTKEVKAWCDELLAERDQYWSSKNGTCPTTDGANPQHDANHKAMLEAYYSK
jgi:putative hydrolase of HD superfamily